MLSGYHNNFHLAPYPTQCINCLLTKQTQAPFKQLESLSVAIGDNIAFNVCGPLEMSIGSCKHFIWIDLKSQITSIKFTKNKECLTITESFEECMAWML